MQRISQLWKSGTAGKLVVGCGGLIGLSVICGTCGILFDQGPAREAVETPYPTPTPIPTATLTPTPVPSPPTPTSIPPTPTQVPPTSVKEWKGVYIGMPADDVLKVWGKGLRSEQVGSDTEGLVVEWIYEDATLTMKRWEIGGVTCYRVAEIRLR